MSEQYKDFLTHIKPLKIEQSDDRLTIEIEERNLYQNIERAKSMGFDYLVEITATDYLRYPKTPSARYALVYILRSTDFKSLLIIKAFLSQEKAQSITPLFKGANWLEREVFDQYGIIFENHPNLKRVLNHHEFVGHPLRKDYIITKGQRCSMAESLMDEMNVQLKENNLADEDHMFLNLGPSHPASHGTIRTLVALDGERVKAAVTEIGYLHRGFEKSAEHHSYSQIIPYTDRLNYCSAVMNNVGYVKTIEEMLGVTVPQRAEQIRVMVMELSRIMDHLVFLAAQLVDMGALTNYWYLYNPREDVYNFLSKLSGARLTNSYMRIGGMSHDLYAGYEEDLETIFKNVQKGCADALAMIKHNRIFHDRTKDVGVISAEDARSYGWSGPNLRACGVNCDMRYLKPYYAYDELDFDVILGSHGDIYDRIMVRFEEIEQSIKIVKQVQRALVDGEINISDRRIILPKKQEVYGSIEGVMNQFKLTFDGIQVKPQEYYGSIEAVNGELGFYVVSDGTGTPYKMKVRAPSFLHIAALPQMIKEAQLADSIVTLASLNIIAGEMDR